MAEPQSNARLRAASGAPTSGVIHVRTRLTADFTVLANELVQRPGSAVTVGVAAYILSLPDGAPVSIAALCAHFTEGEILISRALRELEAAGYLERRRERGPGGRVRTRTYVYDVPPGPGRPGPPPPEPTRRRAPAENAVPDQALGSVGAAEAPPAGDGEPVAVPVPRRSRRTERAPDAAPDRTPLSLPEADPRAVVILASLRIADQRLVLSRREVAELAPAVSRWLAQGVGAQQVTELLTVGLPDHFRARPARILAFRLRDVPVAAPLAPSVTELAKPDVLPWQTCDGCERAFRGAEPALCRDCRHDDEAAPAVADGAWDLARAAS